MEARARFGFGASLARWQGYPISASICGVREPPVEKDHFFLAAGRGSRVLRGAAARRSRRDDGGLVRRRGDRLHPSGRPAPHRLRAGARELGADLRVRPAAAGASVRPGHRLRHDAVAAQPAREHPGRGRAGRRGTRSVVVTTNVYLRSGDGWRMVLHHASPAPAPVVRARGAGGIAQESCIDGCRAAALTARRAGCRAATCRPSIRRCSLRAAAPHCRRERWDTPDGDFVDVDLLDAGAADAPLRRAVPRPRRLLVQPLRARADARAARARGWRGVVLHFRGCSGEPNRLPRAYHSGDTRRDRLDPARASRAARATRRSTPPASRSAATRCSSGWASAATRRGDVRRAPRPRSRRRST